MDPGALRRVLGHFATGVTVITCRDAAGAPHGATVTAFCPISLDPPLVLVALTRTSRAAVILDGADFAVNVLASDQSDVAMHFAGRPGRDAVRWRDGATAPLLCGTAATLSCRAYRTDEGGDHLMFLGEVVEHESHGRDPLLFHTSAFRALGPPTAEASWLGCADDPGTGWFDALSASALLPADSHY